MRRFFIIAVMVLVAVPARGWGWGAKKKIERRCLDILTRRIETIANGAGNTEIKESARKCLYHLDALQAIHGKVNEDDKIVLDSKDEQRVIIQAMGLAAKAEARAGFWREKWNAATRWAWRKVKAALWHWIPIAPILVWAWCSRKRLMRAVFQYDREVDNLPDEVRHRFKGPDLERWHARFKRSGA